MGAGIGAVLILRWFWWRINAVSEIVALTSSLLLAMFFLLGKYLWPQATILGFEFATIPFHIKTLIIVPVSLVCWLTATFLTEPESQDVLNRFYLKVCPGGWWRGIDTALINPEKRVLNARFVINWFSGIVLIFGTTLGLGYAIFQSYIRSLLCIIMAALCGIVIIFTIKKLKSN
jgi:hypothetical protein